MKTKQGSPSGVGSRIYAATKFKPISLTELGFSQSVLRLLMVLLVLPMAWVNAWAGGGTHYISATTADPAQGLVYMSTSNQSNVANSSFKNTQPGGSGIGKDHASCYTEGNGSGCTPSTEYYWARPSRGYVFSGNWGPRPIGTSGANKGLGYTAHPSSATGGCNTADELNLGPWDGTADGIVSSAGGKDATYQRPIAYFSPATKYVITYAVPVGGSYSVQYEYITSYNTGSTESDGTPIWRFKDDGFDFSMTTATEEAREENSYAADKITLSVDNAVTNFIGWYEGETKKSDAKTYVYTAHATGVTISAQFKELAWGDVSGDVAKTVEGDEHVFDEDEDHNPYNGTIYVALPTLIGSWESSDFTITPMNTSNSFGSIAIGTIALDKPNSRLVIPYAYTATNWGGVEANLTITPSFGATKEISITCSAEEKVNYEACIEVNKERVETGDLVDMINIANGNTYENPVVKLMNNKTITAPLSFTNSFTFDVNGNVLTANCASAFSINAAGVDVQIIDGSFTQVGEIHTSSSSASNVNVVTFTQKAKLTMQGGTLSASNTGSGSAYGVNVCNGSIFYMTNGQLTVSANTGDAHGVHVATASDYATLNGGSISVSAPTNAYGLWSAGQSNITDATVSVATTTGTNAYGAYINGGVSTITTTDFTVNALTTGAYGAYVNAGRLNFNGGKLAVEAVMSDVYGAYIAAGGTAMMQQNTKVTAEVSTGNGTVNVEVCGVHNLGTASLNNISVTATNNSTTATANTNYAAAISTNTGAISTTIEDGTYTANAETGYAYAIRHRTGTLTVDGGTFKGILKTSGNGAFGAHVSDNATIANATLYGETKGSGSKAHGVVGNAGTVTLTNCDITGKSNTNKAYAIYSRTGVTATGCTLTATTSGTDQAYGLYAEDGTNALVNCNATVTAQTVKAYGVNHVAGSVTINGGGYTVDAKQGAATGAQNSELYGLYNAASKTTSVTNATFTVIASNAAYSQNVYGACINGTLNSTGATYTAQAKLNVYGVWGNTASTLTLSNNTISSTASNGTKSYGVYAKKNFTIDGDIVSATATSTDVYAMFFDATSVGEVRGGKFSAQGNGTNGYGALNANGTVGNVQLEGGVYKTTINLQKYAYTGYQIYHLDDTHPDYAGGYRYTIAAKNPSPYVCRIIGGAYYATLEEALQYTQDHEGTFTIVMTQPYTLPAGDYVLPANATLIVPRKFGQTTITDNGNPAVADKITTVDLNENFLCLTMASNAHLNVDGKIGVSGEMYCTQSGGVSNQSPYGRIHMDLGSHIQLNSGAYLYAWGMITGSGSITVKSNAEVREMFQVKNMPSASALRFYVKEYNTSNTTRFMPFNQYSIQNIEVPTTYYHNSRLMSEMRCYYQGADFWYGDANIKLVGISGALFEVTAEDESSWVCKSYDATNKQQVWKVNSSAQLGSISITMKLPIINQNITINSANYILPITNTMKIHVLDGDFAITNETELMPGASIEINKTASLTVKSGKKLYVFDKDQWSSSTSYADAAINVHGNINVEGALYTTSSIAGGTNATNGANIFSNNADAGTVSFESDAPSGTTTIDLITGVANDAIVTKTVTMDPAKLKNGTGASQAFTPTSGTDEGHAFAYINNEWQETYTNGCFEVKGTTVYAKPSGYVALKKTQEGDYGLEGVEEANHTYLTADDKILILMPGCQWWEVEETSDPTVFECKKPGYEGFYYYDDTDSDPEEWTWKLKTVNVTFYMKEEGTDTKDKIIVTDFNGRPDQAVIASNPTKETTTGFTYQFYGWKSSVEPHNIYKWTDPLEVATADMSYRPVFTKTKRNYTITLNNANNGASVPLEVPYGDTPEYTAKKDPTAQYTYTFDHWEPAFAAVSGAATYTAIWTSVVNRYTITWMDGETVLETDKHQLYGSATAFNGTLPTKPMDDNFVYTFSGWRSSLTGTTYEDGSTPAVAGETTYEAQFSTTPRYAITFANYDGTQLQKEAVTAGEPPVYNGLTPGRARDLDGYFRFIGWKNSEGTDYAPNATLPAVTGKETYTAQYAYVTELYLITLNNIDGNGGTWSGKFGVGSIPFYNRDNNDVAVEPTQARTTQYEYTFSGWEPEMVPVEGEATYTAQFDQHTRKYNITFANLDGNGAHQTIEVEYGTSPVCPVTPTKDDGINSYPFTGWKNSNGDDYAPDATLPAVAGEETYTATFSSTPIVRQFDITFDLDNGSQVIIPVTYGTTPEWTDGTPTKPATAQYTYTFAGWYPEFAPVTGEETYIAQYTETLNSYTIRFVNYDGTELQSSELAYGVLPTYSGSAPQKPADLVNMKAYNFSGWSSAIATVTGAATYTAQYNEVDLVASVTTASNETSYYGSWSSALSAANSSANCTLRLYQNVTAPVLTKIDQNMTIDLNGCTLSCTTSSTSDNRFIWVNKVALIIDDSKGGGKIYFEGTGNKNYNAVRVDGVGSLTVRGGTIQAHATNSSSSSAAYAVLLYNNSTTQGTTLNMYGGELIASHTQNARTASTVYFNGTNYVNVYGGKLKGKNSIFNNNNSANRVTLRGGYYSLDPGTTLTIPSGYEKWDVGASEPEKAEGYVKKVVQLFTITFQNYDGTNLETPKTWEVGTTPAYSGTTPTKPQDDQYTYAHSGWTPAIVPVEANATYTATFTGTYRDYTITWQDWDGTSLGTTQVPYDNATRPTHEAPTHADPNCSFVGWKAESNGIVYPADELPRVGENGLEATYIAQYECSYADLVVESDDEPISSNTEATTTTIHVNGTLDVEAGVTLTTTNLILEASEAGSGQIVNAGTIMADNVYYDLRLYTAARHWHAFGVPWIVDINTNPLAEVDNDGNVVRTLVVGRDCEIVYYNGATRASQGAGAHCWEYLKHYSGDGHVDVMTPGKGYMIAFTSPVQTVRFVKKSGAPIFFGGTNSVTGGTGENGGWNAIANPMPYHATLASETPGSFPTVGYVHDGGEIGSDGYTPYNIDDKKYIVGKTVYVQAGFNQTIVVNPAGTAGDMTEILPAPKRRAKATDKQYLALGDYYTVSLTNANGVGSKVYVLPEEDKADEYVIGHDLSQFSMSTKKPQVWVNRYDTKLALNTTAPVNGVADFPISLYAPVAGEYTITNDQSPMTNEEEYTVYLTLDGEVIWNLSSSAYALSLSKGTVSNYGIRISAKVPQVATGMDEAVIDAQGETRKVLVNDKVFIIREGNVYSVDGQLVK